MDNNLFDEVFNHFRRQQLLNDETWKASSSETNSRRFRREKNASLDRDTCVQDHNAILKQYTMVWANYSPFDVTTTIVEESPTASAPLSSLKPITLQQLIVGKRHYGRVLHGRLCVKPFRMSAVISVLEDEAGNGVRLIVHNALPKVASQEDIEARLPWGMRVIVKEPFFETCVDGRDSITVHNPADVTFDETWKKDVSSPTSCYDDNAALATLLAELEMIRSAGNELFQVQNWIGAVNKYSECIDKSTCLLGTQNNGKMSDEFNRVVMLAYSNRAEARLRLGAFEDALGDADKALEFDQKQVKTIVRKGKAAYGLGLFEKSCAMFEAALEHSPNEVSILANLKASKIALEQSQTGEYDLSNYHLRRCPGEMPACADFLGPVEIRRVHSCGGGRGLFTMQQAEPGQLLFVSNPLAIARRKAGTGRLDFSVQDQSTGGSNGVVNNGAPLNTFEELADQVMKSKRKMAQFHSLSSYGKLEMEVPSMELFRPGSEWVPPGSELMEVDKALFPDIVRSNAFGSSGISVPKRGSRRASRGDVPVNEEWCGIWALPSFVNHSCGPNCVIDFIGDAVFMRASMHIAEGDELTISYHGSLFEDVEIRRASSKHWSFTCRCERCELEETLKPQLAKIRKDFPNLVKAAEAESQVKGQRKRQAARDLAKTADEVDAVIHSCGTMLDPRQQSWIRATFMSAYYAKVILALDKSDSMSRITPLTVIVDAMTSINVMDLNFSAALLREVKERFSKHSQYYRQTEDRVLGIYKVAFGKQPNSFLHKLIKSRWSRLSPDSLYR